MYIYTEYCEQTLQNTSNVNQLRDNMRYQTAPFEVLKHIDQIMSGSST